MNSKVVVGFMFGLSLAFVTSASAQWPCPTANPITQLCAVQGCASSVTIYRCNAGYGAQTTCGGPCAGAIKCCGITHGYNTLQCNELCAGCKRDEKEVAAAKKSPAAATSKVAAAHASSSSKRPAFAEVTEAKETGPSKAAPVAPELPGDKR